MTVHFTSKEELDPRLAYGSLLIRAGAAAVDALIIILLIKILGGALAAIKHGGFFSETGTLEPAAMPLLRVMIQSLYVIIPTLYFTVFESSRRQATPGKMLMGLLVVDEYGLRLSSAKAARRFIFRAVNLLTLNLGYGLILVDSRRRGLHDYLSSTYVIQLPRTRTQMCAGKCFSLAASVVLIIFVLIPLTKGALLSAAHLVSPKIHKTIAVYMGDGWQDFKKPEAVNEIVEAVTAPTMADAAEAQTKKDQPRKHTSRPVNKETKEKGGMLVF